MLRLTRKCYITGIFKIAYLWSKIKTILRIDVLLIETNVSVYATYEYFVLMYSLPKGLDSHFSSTPKLSFWVSVTKN